MTGFLHEIDKRATSFWRWCAESLFHPVGSDFSRSQVWFRRLWIACLFLIGACLWAFFLNFGRFTWGVQDWIWEWRYSRILKEALTLGQLPLHTEPGVSYDVTRFLGVPDVSLAPQILFLRFLDPGLTFLINLLIMYTVSYLGCLLIKHRMRLSLFSFTILALLFNFNGFITAHIGIGHTMYVGYFILPYFVHLLLRLTESQPPRYWFAQMAMVLFGIELVGSTLLFAECLIFLTVLLIFSTNHRHHIFKAILAGVGLNIYRLVPAAISLSSYSSRPFPGFTTLGDILASLTWIIQPSQSIRGLPMGWWEFDMYVGVLGFVIIFLFGLYFIWKAIESGQTDTIHRPLGITMLIFSAFSIGYLYAPINYLPIPFFNLIHVPSRFLIIPLLILIAMAVVQLQSWINRQSKDTWHQFILLILLVILGHDLFQHLRLWRVEYVFEAFPAEPLEYSLHISNQVDPLYTNTLAISYLFTLIVLGYILYVLIKGRRDRPSEQAG
jgi:hypothetical protein